MNYLGIDQGKKGGLAILDEKCRQIAVLKMPIKDKVVDVDAIHAFVIEHAPVHAFVEKQMILQKQAGALTNGQNSGRVLGQLEFLGIPYTLVKPSHWQKAIHGHSTSDKGRTVAWAGYMGYDVPMTSTRKNATPHDGVADALGVCYGGMALGQGILR